MKNFLKIFFIFLSCVVIFVSAKIVIQNDYSIINTNSVSSYHICNPNNSGDEILIEVSNHIQEFISNSDNNEQVTEISFESFCARNKQKLLSLSNIYEKIKLTLLYNINPTLVHNIYVRAP